MSGCGVSEYDVAAGELFEPAHEVMGLAVFVEAGVVEVGAEVFEAGVGVGQQMPGDREYGVADGDQGSSFPSSFGDPPVSCAQERRGS